jgi:hypothetical protein
MAHADEIMLKPKSKAGAPNSSAKGLLDDLVSIIGTY